MDVAATGTVDASTPTDRTAPAEPTDAIGREGLADPRIDVAARPAGSDAESTEWLDRRLSGPAAVRSEALCVTPTDPATPDRDADADQGAGKSAASTPAPAAPTQRAPVAVGAGSGVVTAAATRPTDPALAAVLDAASDTHDPDEASARSKLLDVVRLTGGSQNSPLQPDHPEYQCIVRQSVLKDIRAHAEEQPSIEICGVLVGTVYAPRQPPLAYVDAVIRGEATSARSTQVTFTAETWQHIHRELEERHPGKQILGWYHSHPGFGIFLSEMDLFIQRNFFNAAWHSALVYDPQAKETGLFGWRRAEVQQVDVVLDDGASRPAMPNFPSLPSLSGAPSATAAATSHSESRGLQDPGTPIAAAAQAELAERLRVLESRTRWLMAGFAIVLIVAIIWPLAAMTLLPQAAPAPQPPPAKQPDGAYKAPTDPSWR